MKIPKKAPCPCCGAANRVAAGADLRKARERSKLTGRQFAKLAGISPSYVSDLENGRRNPTAAVVAKYEEHT